MAPKVEFYDYKTLEGLKGAIGLNQVPFNL